MHPTAADGPPANEDDSPPAAERRQRLLLLASLFVLGACGLVYELVAGAVASYLLGDSVTQYSLVIGAFLAAMGVGAWLSQFVRTDLLAVFVKVQLAVGVIGGYSALALYAAFAASGDIALLVLVVTAVVGALVGMEVPLVLRLLDRAAALRVTVAQVLTVDYVGALAASVAFPFAILPLLGVVRAALVFGALNLAVASLATGMFWEELPQRRRLAVLNVLAWAAILSGLFAADGATSWLEDRMYQDPIVLAETTPYQRIVITRWRNDYRLHLNGHLQFSSVDEYRYHESLVLPPLAAALAARRSDEPLRVLILGGGDGLAARHVLRAPGVARIDLVDIDPRVTGLFRDQPALAALNAGSLADPRVHVHAVDALTFLRESDGGNWHAILMDLPDPSSVPTNKLYTTVFFGLALRRLADGGVLVTQATSPFYAREAFWCIAHTLEAANRQFAARRPDAARRRIVPYHAYVPSFGDWGFVMAIPEDLDASALPVPDGSRYLTPDVYRRALVFPPDTAELDTDVNELDRPVLIRYHEAGWSAWNE